MYGNTYSAFTEEPLNGCLRNLVGIKILWLLTCNRRFCQIRLGADTGGGTKVGQGVPFFKKTYSSECKATTTNRMQSNDLRSMLEEIQSLVFDTFWCHIGLIHFQLYSFKFFNFLRCKVFIYIIVYNFHEKKFCKIC